MRRLTALLIICLLGSFVSAAAQSNARTPHAGTPSSNANNTGFLGKGRYRIQSVTSGHFLDLRREDKQTLQQWSSSGTLNQQWDVEDAGGGYFYIRSAETGGVLEATGTRDGSSVLARGQQTGRDNQKWRVVDLGSGQSLIVARSGKVLDVADNARSEGARVQIWGEHRGDNQRFRFDRVEMTNQYVGGRIRNESLPPVPGRGSGETLAPGRMRWRGRVDEEVLLEVRGSAVMERLVRGNSFNNGRYTFTVPLPKGELNLRIEKRKARGVVEIVARPAAANNYTAVIRISDPQRDAADYEFELIW